MLKLLRRHKILAASFLVCVTVAIILVILYSKLSQPVSVQVSASSKSSNAVTYSINLTPKNISDSYISFNYPEGMTLRSQTPGGGNSVDDYRFYAKDVYSWSLNIDVSNIPLGELSQDSSYQIRIKDPSEYKQQDTNVNGQPAVIMTDSYFTSGFSKVAFLTHAGQVATVSLIGDDSTGTEPLQTSFNMVIGGWQWH